MTSVPFTSARDVERQLVTRHVRRLLTQPLALKVYLRQSLRINRAMREADRAAFWASESVA